MDSQFGTGQQEEEQATTPAISPLEIVQFTWRAAKRHALMGTVVAGGVLVVGALISAAVPLWYESQVRILVEDSADKTTQLLGGRVRDSRTPDPIRESSELVKQKTKMQSMVVDSHILANWDSIRPLPLRIKDKVQSFLQGPMSDEAKLEVLAEMLTDRVGIWSERGIVTISAQWRDPVSAQKLAQLTKDRLIDSLQVQEFSSINAAISLLDNQARRAAENIAPARDAVARARNGGVPASTASTGNSKQQVGAPAVSATSSVASPAPEKLVVTTVAKTDTPAINDIEAEQIRQNNRKMMEQLTALREQIRAVETPWQRRLAELKVQLSDMQVTFGPEHPAVVQQRARIETASVPPPELQQLQDQEQSLLLKVKSGEQDVPQVGQRPRLTRTVRRSVAVGAGATEPATIDTKDSSEDPAVIAAMAELQSAIAKYTELAARTDAARFELMIAQVAFQHQYVVVRAPEVPKAPKKQMGRLILLGSIGAAGLIGFLFGAIRDLLSGKVVAPWQVKLSGLQSLGELELPGR